MVQRGGTQLRYGHATDSQRPGKRVDAARFLTQASFGARSTADIDDVLNRRLPRSSTAVAAPWSPTPTISQPFVQPGGRVEEQHIYEAIWQNLIFGDARLRARVALALSKSWWCPTSHRIRTPMRSAFWMDTLYKNAFGNYRTLLCAT